MLLQVGILFAGCLAITSCSNNFPSESRSDLSDIESSNYIQQISANNTIQNRKDFQIQPKSQDIAQQSSVNLQEISDRKNGTFSSDNSQPSSVGHYMTLKKTDEQNNFGNPLFELQLNIDGQKLSSHLTVSGRYYTQNRDLDVSGTEAPLPKRKGRDIFIST